VPTDLFALIREAKRLEAVSMGIYVRFAQRFASDQRLHAFWMSMARHEAGHIGALELLEAMVRGSRETPRIQHGQDAVSAAARAIERLDGEAGGELSVERAFELAVELESTELEDLVLDLIHGLSSSEQRKQAAQMVVHDLSDLALMIERYTNNDELLARADALVQRHVSD
jgi:hypothetical protein